MGFKAEIEFVRKEEEYFEMAGFDVSQPLYD